MSGQLFHWARLVRKYSRPVQLLVQQEGCYQGGLYQAGRTESVLVQGAILSLKRSARNDAGGNYAQEEKRLYLLSPIPHALERVQVVFDGQRYTVTADRDHGNEDFTGVFVYLLTGLSKEVTEHVV